MFKGITGMASMMKQAQELQSKMGTFQESLKDVTVTGEAGGGMVKVTANGQQAILNCEIEPSILEAGDQEMLEDLIVSAVNQALDRAKQTAADKMSEMTGGMNLPGLQDAMSNMGIGPQSP
ncbi:MAG: YbaB/EbfC family nucleoid-associated protein [Planctomycetaceae bacterium]|nr:YbaB/EbfC family nucleoid-associated protein [Planctomycetaceae bacterium]